MALSIILEDGSSVTGANSYVTVAEISAFSETLLGTTWDDNTSLHIMAAVNASRFIDQKYGARFYGSKLTSTQGLLYPRTSCDSDNSGIPTALKNAVCYAAIQFIEDGGLDLNANQENAIKSTSVNVGAGAVSESISYFYPQTTNIYAPIDSYMSGLVLKPTNSFNITTLRG